MKNYKTVKKEEQNKSLLGSTITDLVVIDGEIKELHVTQLTEDDEVEEYRVQVNWGDFKVSKEVVPMVKVHEVTYNLLGEKQSKLFTSKKEAEDYYDKVEELKLEDLDIEEIEVEDQTFH